MRDTKQGIGRAADAGIVLQDPGVVLQDPDVVLQDPGVNPRHAGVARAAAGLFYAQDLRSAGGTFLGLHGIGVALLREGDRLKLGANLGVQLAVVGEVERPSIDRADARTAHDPLTRGFRRTSLDDRLVAEIANAQRTKTDLAVSMIGVDALDEVNLHFGRLAGDRVLSTVASRVLGALRVGDLLARYGGDEFALLAPETTGSDARLLAQRVQRSVDGLRLIARGREVHVTVSVGVATLSELHAGGDPSASLLSLAHARLCGAKAAGHNHMRGVHSPPEHGAAR